MRVAQGGRECGGVEGGGPTNEFILGGLKKNHHPEEGGKTGRKKTPNIKKGVKPRAYRRSVRGRA